MRTAVLLLALMAFAACKEDNDPIPLCIEVPEKSIALEDSLMVVNCNDDVLGVGIEGDITPYAIELSDTLYLHFDSTGTYTLYYYRARYLPVLSGPFPELLIRVE
jgi:hypothetical protein